MVRREEGEEGKEGFLVVSWGGSVYYGDLVGRVEYAKVDKCDR